LPESDAPMSTQPSYSRILVPVDFSPYTEATVTQAVWLARKSGAAITLVNCLPNLRHLVESASYPGKVDFLYGDGTAFLREVEQESEGKLKKLVSDMNAGDLRVNLKTIVGAPYAEVSRLVMSEGYDLVIAGTRGLSVWKQFFLGSTSHQLIRNCPSSVWVVRVERVEPPKVVLAATDFSDVSRRAVLEGLKIAEHADAEFHLVHVIDSTELPEATLIKNSWANSLRLKVEEQAGLRLAEFADSLGADPKNVRTHLVNGAPWHDVGLIAKQVHADLVAIGTIGRSGISGVLLGNTAERLLNTCDCSVLAVKPADFVSPVLPAIVSTRLNQDNVAP
jgi:universal stress protein E